MLRTSVYNTEEKISTLANGIVHKKRIPYDCQEMIKKTKNKHPLETEINFVTSSWRHKATHLFQFPFQYDKRKN